MIFLFNNKGEVIMTYIKPILCSTPGSGSTPSVTCYKPLGSTNK